MKNVLLVFVLFFSINTFAASAGSVNTITEKTKKEIKKEQKLKKLLNSKFGQWLIKKSYVSARKKQLRKQLKGFQGTKAEKRAFKKAQKQIIKDEKAQLSGNMRIGLIIGIIGIILTLFPNPLNIIGLIMIVVGLIFILIDLI